MLPSLLSVAIPLGFRHDSFWANVYFKGDFPAVLTTRQHCLNKTSALHTELQYDSHTDSFCFGICNTQWEVLLSKQVNYNQVMVKCQILQDCFLQNFNMKKFQNKEHSNSRTFQGPGIFCQNSRTSQGPYEPCCVQIVWELMLAISYHTKNIIAAY